jgi:hypothetical protein
MTVQTFGCYRDDLSCSTQYLRLVFSPDSASLQHRWRNNGLSADFLADYLASFFPDEDDLNPISRREEVRGAVSYIANELLENAMKFHDPAQPNPITITLQLQRDRLVFVTENTIATGSVPEFQDYIQQLLTLDPSELYLNRLESNAAGHNGDSSGLGLLTMLNDYHVELGWKFAPIFPHDDSPAPTPEAPAAIAPEAAGVMLTTVATMTV